MNLKQIFIADTDNDKLDKVNYNFDQILANGGGPIGAQGSIGAQGFTGFQGDQGPQGAQGLQGSQGPSGLDGDITWKLNESAGANNSTLIPIHDSQTYTNPPTIMIGVDDNDSRYNDVLQDVALLINRKSSVFNDNLYLTDDTTPSTRIIFRVATQGGITTYSEGFNVANGIKKYGASKFIYGDGQNEYASISNTELKVNVDTLIKSNSEFRGADLKINLGNPGIDKILTSSDTSGTAVWKSISELQAGVPVGTIVPILTSVFDDVNNFDKGFTYPTASGSKLNISFGKGINNYEGWYLCHGETWIQDTISGPVFYSVPDLSSFSYTIAADTSNANGQGAANKTDNFLAIPGGADITMTATYSGGTYTITRAQDTSNISIYSDSNGTEYKLYKMVYVVFLGQSDLYWQDPGAAVGTELVFTNIPFYYSNQSGTTNMWTNGLQSQYSQNLTLVVPSSNSSFSAWQQVYNSGNWTLADIKAAWRNISLVFYDNGNSANSAKLYSGTYTSGSQSNTLAGSGTYNLDGYLRYSPAPGVVLMNNGTLEGTNASTGITVINGFDSNYTQSYSSVSPNSNISIYASRSNPSWRASNIGDWDLEYSANGSNPWSSIGGMNSVGTSGGTTAMGSLIAPSSAGNHYYRSIFNINDSSGVGPDYISPTLTLNVSSPYAISGTTLLTASNTSGSGFITVNSAPVDIMIDGFGGAGGSSCYTNANIDVYKGGVYYGSMNLYLTQYQNGTDALTLSTNGTYTYSMSASFGCTSGNNVQLT